MEMREFQSSDLKESDVDEVTFLKEKLRLEQEKTKYLLEQIWIYSDPTEGPKLELQEFIRQRLSQDGKQQPEQEFEQKIEDPEVIELDGTEVISTTTPKDGFSVFSDFPEISEDILQKEPDISWLKNNQGSYQRNILQRKFELEFNGGIDFFDFSKDIWQDETYIFCSSEHLKILQTLFQSQEISEKICQFQFENVNVLYICGFGVEKNLLPGIWVEFKLWIFFEIRMDRGVAILLGWVKVRKKKKRKKRKKNDGLG